MHSPLDQLIDGSISFDKCIRGTVHTCYSGASYAEAIDLASLHNVHDNATSHDSITSPSAKEKSFSAGLC